MQSDGLVQLQPNGLPGLAHQPALRLYAKRCLYAKQNGYLNTGRQSVTYASNTSGAPVSGINPTYWVSFTVSERLPQLFSAVLGQYWAQVSSRATAAVFLDPFGACIYGLDATAPDTTWQPVRRILNPVAAFTIIPVIRKPRSEGRRHLNASAVKIVGNYATEGGGTVSPTPSVNQTAVADPFGSLPAPTDPGRCDSNGITGNFGPSAASINADGKYVICGDIKLAGNNTQTFPAATYIVKGSITWGSNGHVTGTGVTFYLTSANLCWGEHQRRMRCSASAPSSGTYRGVLFYLGPHHNQPRQQFCGRHNAGPARAPVIQLAAVLLPPDTSPSSSGIQAAVQDLRCASHKIAVGAGYGAVQVEQGHRGRSRCSARKAEHRILR